MSNSCHCNNTASDYSIDDIGYDEDFNTQIISLGETKISSPLSKNIYTCFIKDDERVLVKISEKSINDPRRKIMSFEVAGPREHIYFDPSKLKCAITTCGGLCPGINDVIRSLVLTLYYGYGVKSIVGVKYGFRGFIPDFNLPFVEFTPENVTRIHEYGGTILGSSRGHQPIDQIVDSLERMNASVLFLIGGDGTFRAGAKIVEEIEKRRLKTSLIAIPKTIDNDIYLVSRTFGFETAVEMACQSIQCAHTEAVGAPNGIGIVKVMGRHAGFIAAAATNALRDVNFCLIPESDFDLEGENGLLESLRKRLESRKHAVIVVAEGAGQKFFPDSGTETDLSENVKLKDIGRFLKNEIIAYFKKINMETTIRYIDPSYIVRSVPASVADRLYCANLAQNAVHAAMAGKTGMMISLWNDKYVHVPIESAISKKKQINLNSRFWLSVLESTGQSTLRNECAI